MKRCDWANSHELMTEYHDYEWGVPLHDDKKLFEFLLLEGAQAGLTWLSILKRRESYSKVFENFDPYKISAYSDPKLKMILTDTSIIRNRLKVEAFRINAQKYLEVVDEFGSFDRFIWSFTGHETIVNSWEHQDESPANTPESTKMSKELKKRGFKFVGPTICYAFMQATGMVNDHIISCFRYDELR